MKETATKFVDKILQNLQENREQFIELIVNTYETAKSERKTTTASGNTDDVISGAIEAALKPRKIRKQKIDNGCDKYLCDFFVSYAMNELAEEVNGEEEIDNVYSEVGDAK